MLEKSKVEEQKRKKTNIKDLIKKKDYEGLSNHLKEGISDYLKSDTFKSYLEFIANFHKYSAKNVRLILAQNPHASYVAGYQTWKKMERNVRKGEKALYIYTPSIRDKVDSEGNKEVDKNGEVIKDIRYFLTPVFDASQTEGNKPIPKMAQKIEGDLEDPKKFALLFQTISNLSDVPVSLEPIQEIEANGYYDPTKKQIVIQEGLGEIMTIKVLIHELVHSVLHTNSAVQFGDEIYKRQEFEAESIAYIVSQHLGIDTSNYSFGYLASWTELGNTMEDLTESFETITKQASTLIEKIDHTLSKAYTLELPKNKFEERILEARIQLGKEPRKAKEFVKKEGQAEEMAVSNLFTKKIESHKN